MTDTPSQAQQWYSQSQAAKAVGVSETTIRRYRNKNTLIAEPDPRGGFRIPIHELQRVFPDWNPLNEAPESERGTTSSPTKSDNVTASNGELEALKLLLAEKDRRIDDLSSQVEKAEGRAEKAEERNHALSMALTHQKDETPSTGLVGRLFGRK